MTSDSAVVPLRQPDTIDNPPTAVPRSGARLLLLVQAVEAEAETFRAMMKDARLPDGRERLVRHGLGLASLRPDHGPERVIQTGIGVEPRGSPDPVEVQRVRPCDRGADADRIRFSSAILPRWARRTRSVEPRRFTGPGCVAAGPLPVRRVDG